MATLAGKLEEHSSVYLQSLVERMLTIFEAAKAGHFDESKVFFMLLGLIYI